MSCEQKNELRPFYNRTSNSSTALQIVGVSKLASSARSGGSNAPVTGERSYPVKHATCLFGAKPTSTTLWFIV
jgi:hypothetical protein